MTNTQTPSLLRQIRRLVTAHCPSEQPDVQLLEQFIAGNDECAFAALVQRHGNMVLGICRSVLHHRQDAEDVFQATFLVLARRAGSIRKQQSVSSWLHGVAYRLALKVRARSDRLHDRRPSIHDPFAPSPLDELTVRESHVILHEELRVLAEKYRAALLLCYWEGKTRDEAAEQLGMTAGSFKKCLERARTLLGSRLTRRGLLPSAAFFASLLSTNGVKGAIPPALTRSTAQAAVTFVTGKGAVVCVPAVTAIALANGVIQTMKFTKLATTLIVIFIVGVLGTGLGLTAFQGLGGGESRGPDEPAPAKKRQGQVPPVKNAEEERIELVLPAEAPLGGYADPAAGAREEESRRQIGIQLSRRKEVGPIRCSLKAIPGAASKNKDDPTGFFFGKVNLPELEVKVTNTSREPVTIPIFQSVIDDVTFIFRDPDDKIVSSFCYLTVRLPRAPNDTEPPIVLKPGQAQTSEIYLSVAVGRGFQVLKPGIYSIEAVFHGRYFVGPPVPDMTMLARSQRLKVRVVKTQAAKVSLKDLPGFNTPAHAR